MKAILEFDLENHEDRMSHLRCIKSSDMSSVIWEITHNLRKSIDRRFESQPQSGRDEFDGVEEVFMEIYKLLDKYNINIDELTE